MPTRFDNKVVTGIGLTPTDVLVAGANERITIVGFNVTNGGSNDCNFDVYLTDATPTTGNYLTAISLPSSATFKVITNGERLVLGPTSKITVKSSQPNSLHIVLSFVVIT